VAGTERSSPARASFESGHSGIGVEGRFGEKGIQVGMGRPVGGVMRGEAVGMGVGGGREGGRDGDGDGDGEGGGEGGKKRWKWRRRSGVRDGE